MLEAFRVDTLFFNPKTVSVTCQKTDTTLTLDVRTYHLLQLLALSPTKLCERSQLLDEIWQGKVVSDDSLTNLVSQARLKLRKFDNKLIITVPKVGYSIQGDVEPGAVLNTNILATPNSPESAAQTKALETHRSRLLQPAAIGLIGVVLVAVLIWIIPEFSDSPAENALAILPFEVISEDKKLGAYAAELNDELNQLLANYPGLNIIPQLEINQVTSQNLSLNQLSEHLNTKYVIEGTIRGNADEIKISVQFIDAQSAVQVFSRAVNTTSQSFDTDSNVIIQTIGRLILSEIPRQVLQVTNEDSSAVEKQKCDSYLKLAELYAKEILHDVSTIASSAESACIAYALANPEDSKTFADVANLYTLMATGSREKRVEKLSFMQLANQYLVTSFQLNPANERAFEVETALDFLRIQDTLNNGTPDAEVFNTVFDNVNEAISYYPHNIKLLSSRAETYRYLGVYQRRKGESPLSAFKQGKEELEQLLALVPTNHRLWASLAQLNMSMAANINDSGESPIELLQACIKSFQEAIQHENNIPAYYRGLAEASMVLADFFTDAPAQANHYYNQAEVAFQKVLAMSINLQGIESNLADLNRRRARAMINRGEDAATTLQKGIDHGNKAIALEPDYVWSHFALMELHRMYYHLDYSKNKTLSEHANKCVEVGNHAMTLKSDSARAWYSLIDCQQLEVRMYLENNQALAAKTALSRIQTDIDKALTLDPNYPKTLLLQGINHLLLSMASDEQTSLLEAEKALQQAIESSRSKTDGRLELLETYLYQLKLSAGNNTGVSAQIDELINHLNSNLSRDAGFEVLKLAYQHIVNNEPAIQDKLAALSSEFQLSYQASVRKYQHLLH